jgi:hypothetical protein
MSRGTFVTTLRIPPALREVCQQYLAVREKNPMVPPWTMTDLILNALREKLSHIKRSSRPRKGGGRRAV